MASRKILAKWNDNPGRQLCFHMIFLAPMAVMNRRSEGQIDMKGEGILAASWGNRHETIARFPQHSVNPVDQSRPGIPTALPGEDDFSLDHLGFSSGCSAAMSRSQLRFNPRFQAQPRSLNDENLWSGHNHRAANALPPFDRALLKIDFNTRSPNLVTLVDRVLDPEESRFLFGESIVNAKRNGAKVELSRKLIEMKSLAFNENDPRLAAKNRTGSMGRHTMLVVPRRATKAGRHLQALSW